MPPQRPPGHILLIDDDEVTLFLAQQVLIREGYIVTTTADGPQGISLYFVIRPDIVLLDLGLPTMNGLEVLRRIKAGDPEARVIVISGYGSERNADEALRSGASDFLQKPCSATLLLDKVRSAIYV